MAIQVLLILFVFINCQRN